MYIFMYHHAVNNHPISVTIDCCMTGFIIIFSFRIAVNIVSTLLN